MSHTPPNKGAIWCLLVGFMLVESDHGWRHTPHHTTADNSRNRGIKGQGGGRRGRHDSLRPTRATLQLLLMLLLELRTQHVRPRLRLAAGAYTRQRKRFLGDRGVHLGAV